MKNVIVVALLALALPACIVDPTDEPSTIGEAELAIIGPEQPTVISAGYAPGVDGTDLVLRDSFAERDYDAARDGVAYDHVATWNYKHVYLGYTTVSKTLPLADVEVAPDPKRTGYLIGTVRIPAPYKADTTVKVTGTASIIGPE